MTPTRRFSYEQRPQFASTGVTSIEYNDAFASLAPAAGARIAQLIFGHSDNAASSIGLLRDAVVPEPAASARDYIAAYTHPLPAGTFNRKYACATAGISSISCSYDAPDLPEGGGHFERTLRFDTSTHELIIDERFAARDAGSNATLESISGFAMAPGDTLVAPAGASGAGVIHGGRLVALRWHAGDVRLATVRATRGAALITLGFKRSPVELRIGSYAVESPAAAEQLLLANSS